jgi:hypothetical protein
MQKPLWHGISLLEHPFFSSLLHDYARLFDSFT